MSKITIVIDGKELSPLERLSATNERAYIQLKKFKDYLGPDRLREMLTEESARSEKKYLEFYRKSRPGVFKKAQAEVFVENCTAQDFMKEYLAPVKKRESNPEHIIAGPVPGRMGESEILETIGMDKDALRFKICHMKEGQDFPFEPEPGCTLALRAEMKTMNDEPLGQYAFHQFFDTPEGLRVKLCIAFAEATDDAIVNGQKLHLAEEFYNWLLAASTK